jgi:hypothetical protein
MAGASTTRTLRTIGLGAFFLWAAFWSWFSLAEAVSDVQGGWSHLVLPFAPIVIAIGLVVWRPRFGAWFLIATGAAFALIFRAPFAWAALAAPPVISGVLLTLANTRPRTRKA